MLPIRFMGMAGRSIGAPTLQKSLGITLAAALPTDDHFERISI